MIGSLDLKAKIIKVNNNQMLNSTLLLTTVRIFRLPKGLKNTIFFNKKEASKRKCSMKRRPFGCF